MWQSTFKIGDIVQIASVKIASKTADELVTIKSLVHIIWIVRSIWSESKKNFFAGGGGDNPAHI
jgi:hypothetical protein